MNIPFELNGKIYNIKAYTTAIEKDILLLSSFDVNDLDSVLDVLGFCDYKDLSEDEKKVILYKHREISLGDVVDVKFKCNSCGQGNDGELDAGNFAIPGKRNDKDIKKLNKEFHESNMQDYVDIDVDELDIDEYELLKQRIIDNQTTISFIKEAKCLKCGTSNKFNLGSPEYIMEIMSDDSLMTLYKSYNFLIFFGHYSKSDIDNMYPFERSIFIGLLNKTKEDLAK
jgi:hypothetical protein